LLRQQRRSRGVYWSIFAPALIGTLIISENAFEQASGYLQYVRDPRNGYLSQRILFDMDMDRGNEFTVVTR